MRGRWRVGAVLWLGGLLPWAMSAPAPVAGRDPFRLPGAHCAGPEQGWRYAGSVIGVAGAVALVHSPDRRWLRMAPGEHVDRDWQIAAITPQSLQLAHRGDCGDIQLELTSEIVTPGGP
ncbi:DUF2531 family protein [Shimwellia pseudoproteus]|uniref:HofP DNA utilization family protein n=1 Tax=Shimwellia pseudoproteus TaxID=570012 RepID=UPI0018EA9227|nr:HofP DNA utilization family protein [Shimwellia pseudoproteus]MBJ3815012.1 DUF2531 family protein [Shimwellia pseudoproteus]